MAHLTAAKGLVVYRNELSTPEGALSQADNINIDEPDVITPRRGFQDYSNPLPEEDLRVDQLMSYKGIILRHFGDYLQYESNSQFVDFSESISKLDSAIRIKSQESNGNLYFTSSDGIKKISLKNTSDISPTSIKQAGVPAAIDVSAQTIIQEGGFLPPESKVAYKVLFGYKDANNNLLLGTASPRYTVINQSTNIKLPERTRITLNAMETLTTPGIQDEDYITYSTKIEDGTSGSDYLFWFNKTKEKPQETKIKVNVDTLVQNGTGKYQTLHPYIGLNKVYVSGGTLYLATINGLLISTDNGATFTQKTTAEGLGSNEVQAVLVLNGILYVGTSGGLSISTNNGDSFVNKTITDGLANNNIQDIVASSSTIYVATEAGVNTTLNSGSTFSSIAGLSGQDIKKLNVNSSGTTIFAASNGNGLYISTNSGVSFVTKTTIDGLGSNFLNSVTVNGANVYVATSAGFSLSTNSGTSFTNKTVVNGLGNNQVSDVTFIDNIIYAATVGGLSVSNDNGTSFNNKTVINSDLSDNDIVNTFIANNRLYVATAAGLSVNLGIVDGDYVLLDTKNLSKYFIWFKRTATATTPTTNAKLGRTVVEVDLSTIVLNYPTTPTDTPSPNIVAADKLGSAMAIYTSDIIVTIQNDEVTITDKQNGPVTPISTTNNETDITVVVDEGKLPLADTYKPNVPEAFKRLVYKVDIKDATDNNQAALILADVLQAKIPDIDVTISSNIVTITNTNKGNVVDCATNVIAPNDAIQIVVVQQGEITSGDFCDTSVKIVVPSGIDTNYFYQLYRSETVTASDFLSLDELEPSDEFNLVMEKPVSPDGITIPTEITVVDDVPEDFRASNTPLYSNALSGSGILQTNDQPPVAKDIALFKNNMFYANTKGVNFMELALLPGVDLLSGESLYITDNEKSTKFNFVGSARTYTLDFDTKANTDEFQVLKIHSALNERKFALWTALSESSIEPSQFRQDGYEPVRVDLANASTISEIKEVYVAIFDQLSKYFILDESSILTGDSLIFENAENGSSNAPVIEGAQLGSAWGVASVDGEGEDYGQNNVLVSKNLSPSLALDITTRSLIRVINNDINSPVSAQYISSPDTVPGKIRLKSKQIKDESFYLGLSTSSTNVTSVFDTLLPLAYIPTQSVYSSNTTTLTIGSHILQVGNRLVLRSYGQTYIKSIVSITSTTITIDGSITPTNNIVNPDIILYLTTAESKNDENPSRIYFSKVSQPEAVPIVNYLDVGSRDQQIKRIVALRDSLLVLKEDGIFVVSGSSAANFSVRLLSSTSIIICPDSAQVLNNNLYFLSTQGVVSVNESSDAIISRQIENLIKDVTRPNFPFEKLGFAVGYENDRAYLLWLPTESNDEVATQCYRYNIFERTWTRWTVAATCGVINRLDDTMYIGDGTRPYVQKERKTGNRTDHSDRNFTVGFSQGNHFGDKITIESVSNVDVGDTIVQTQYVTISYFNRLLAKLSLDTSLSFDYLSLEATNGDSISSKTDELVAALGTEGIFVGIVASPDNEVLKSQYNDEIIPMLNSSVVATSIKNYPGVVDVIEYEAIITAVNRITNTVTLNFNIPFIEGSLEVYKHINCVVEWQPQHFGDPSQLKQIREASVMFDQNNFYTAKLGFATDLSQNFVDIPMPGRGVGYWGYGQWGTADFYWGGDGNDSPFRTVVPVAKQRCRYLTLKVEHNEARSYFRIVGISCPIRPLSTRAYRK